MNRTTGAYPNLNKLPLSTGAEARSFMASTRSQSATVIGEQVTVDDVPQVP